MDIEDVNGNSLVSKVIDFYTLEILTCDEFTDRTHVFINKGGFKLGCVKQFI